MGYRSVKGMNDILPEESQLFRSVEELFRNTVERYGFREVRTPLVEDLELFHRSTGETSEVVQKQMFVLPRGDETLALRPEGTPSAARAYIHHKVNKQEQVTKWYYIGAMFRAERPQRGRYRQFHQAGCELYGDAGPICDAEMIDMLYRLTQRLQISGVKVLVNSLGGSETRKLYHQGLRDFFAPLKAALSEHAQERLNDNPLRILDSKDPKDQEACQGAPQLVDYLTEEDRVHFEGLKQALDELGTPYEVDPHLVRGLDYYTRTCFEIVAKSGEIGSQSALLGGGRYDTMLSSLGGGDTPALGFALGIERILLAMPKTQQEKAPLCFVAPLGPKAALTCLPVVAELRQAGFWVELDSRGQSLKGMLRRANNLGAEVALVMGEQELETKMVQVKDLVEHQSTRVPLKDVVTHVSERLRSSASLAQSGESP